MPVLTTLLAASVAVMLIVAPSSASAESLDHRRGWNGPGKVYPYAGRSYYGGYRNPRGYGRYRPYYSHGRYRYDDGAAVAAGVAGLAVGAILGGALAAPRQPAYVYANPAPWTPAWYRYCESRYRSFDPGSGTFLGYDGRRHFCR